MRMVTCIACGLIPLLAQQQPAIPEPAACARLVIVMPRDEWRLTLTPDGAAWINYAQLPHTARVEPGTFRFGLLHEELKARVRLSCRGERTGTVEFVTMVASEPRTTWCLDDEAYAAAEFERAWASVRRRAGPAGDRVDVLESMWQRRKAPLVRKER